MAVMYHATSMSNRESILSHGLLRSKSETAQLAKEMEELDWEKYGGIFLKTMIDEGNESNDVDVWEVVVDELILEKDETTEPCDANDTWWVTWVDDVIPPERLRLIKPAFSISLRP